MGATFGDVTFVFAALVATTVNDVTAVSPGGSDDDTTGTFVELPSGVDSVAGRPCLGPLPRSFPADTLEELPVFELVDLIGSEFRRGFWRLFCSLL